MPVRSVTAFAPATVSNVACGFDVLGFALEGPGDTVTVERTDDARGVRIRRVTGDEGRLPTDAAFNTAGVAVGALLDAYGLTAGVLVDVHKGLPLASGLGSSAASAVAAVVATDALFGLHAPPDQLLRAALEGERVACGARHADNAAPALYGGFVLVRAIDPIDVIPLPVPNELSCALLHPRTELATRTAREALGQSVPLAVASAQWANVGALVAGLFRADYGLIGRSLHDGVAEPRRAPLVPGFREVQRAALDAGALGCSLSGSGPAIFALCRGREQSATVLAAMRQALVRSTNLDAGGVVSALPASGARVCEIR